MRIKSLEASNFKSFKKIQMEFKGLDVIIGANASGKSNFVSILNFLRDSVKIGLDNAIAMQGGVECIRNLNIGSSQNLRVAVLITSSRKESSTFEFQFERGDKKVPSRLDLREAMYEFEVDFYKRRIGYTVGQERLHISLDLIEGKKENGKFHWADTVEKCEMDFALDKKGKLTFRHEPEPFPAPIGRLFPFMTFKDGIPKMKSQGYRKNLLLLGAPIGEMPVEGSLAFFSPYMVQLQGFLRRIQLYDIDPKLAKRSTLITGKTKLEPDGSNLAVVLKNILSEKKNRKRISSLIKDLLPFIEDLNVEKLADRSLLASSKEEYCGKRFLPAPLLSDGTINLTALIVALYFEKNPVIIIEEPERNIHPRLISKLIDMIRDVSLQGEKQIIVTTHNPEVVKHAGIDTLILIHRDEHFSVIHRPVEEEMVRNFLKNEIGVDELFVKNLLGG